MIDFNIQKFVLENYLSNTFLISKTQESVCYLIDIGNVKEAIAFLQPKQYIKAVFLTHAHYDHIADIHYLLKRFPDCLIYCSLETKVALANSKLNLSFYHGTPIEYSGENIVVLNDFDTVTLYPNQKIVAIATPGHHIGCLSFQYQQFCFTGDSLIPEIAVVTKLKTGNKQMALNSIAKLKIHLDLNTVIMPGHGEQINYGNLNWDFFFN